MTTNVIRTILDGVAGFASELAAFLSAEVTVA